MSRSLMIAGASLALAAVAYYAGRARAIPTAAPTQAAQSPATLGFDPPEIDVGPQPWGLEVPFTATLRNDTGSTATLRAITPSCGCTVIDSSQYAGAEVAAGDILDIVGTIDVGTVLGPHRKQIDVLLDGGSVRSVFVRFDTFATYDVSPRDLAFGDVDLQNEEDRVLSVLFVSNSAKVQSAGTDVSWLDAATHEAAPGRFEIAARLTAALLPPGPSFGRVLVRTDDPSRPTFSVPVHASGVAKLVASPRHVFLRPGERRVVQFITPDGTIATLLVAEETEHVTAKILPGGQELEVALGPTAQDRNITEPIHVRDSAGNRSVVFVSCVSGLDDS